MTPVTTSRDARSALAAIEAALPQASAEYDDALATGVGIDAAEKTLQQKLRTRDRLMRQSAILREVERKAAIAKEKHARQEADDAVVRCRALAAAAFAAFMPHFRARLAEILSSAHQSIGAELEDLDAAQARSDELHGRPLAEIVAGIEVAYELERHDLSVLARLHLPDEQLRPFSADTIALLALESSLRAITHG